MSIEDERRNQRWIDIKQAPINRIMYGLAPSLWALMADYEALNAALVGEFSDKASDYADDIAPFADKIQPLQILLFQVKAALEEIDVLMCEAHPVVYCNGITGMYTAPEEEE